MTEMLRPRGVRAVSGKTRGIHKSVGFPTSELDFISSRTFGGMTPTTVVGRPFNWIALPTMAGSLPNRRCQSGVAQDRDRRHAVVSALLIGERASEERRHAKDLKKALCDDLPGELFRSAVAGKDSPRIRERAHILERGRALPPPQEVAGADHVVSPGTPRCFFP